MRLILLAIGAVIILAILWDGLRRKKQQQRRVEEDRFFDKGEPSIDDGAAQSNEEIETQEHQHEPAFMHKESPPASEQQIIRDEHVEKEVEEHKVEPATTIEAHANDVLEEIKEQVHVHVRPVHDVPEVNMPDVVWFTIVADEEKPFGGFSLLQVLLSNGFRFADDKLFYFHQNREASGQKLFGLAAATQDGVFDLSNMARFNCKGLIMFLHTKDHPDLSSAFNEMIDVAENLAEDLEAELFVEQDTPWNAGNVDALRNSLGA